MIAAPAAVAPLALTADGGLQLGQWPDGRTRQRRAGACRTPAEVLGLRSVSPLIEVAAGRHHSLALGHWRGVLWGMCGTPGECVDAPRRRNLGGRASAIGCATTCAAPQRCRPGAVRSSAAMRAWSWPRRPPPSCRVLRAACYSSMRTDASSCRPRSTAAAAARQSPGETPARCSSCRRMRREASASSRWPVGRRCARACHRVARYVFGETGELVPLHELRGVVRFTGGPSHILAVDASRLVRLSAVQSTAAGGAAAAARRGRGAAIGEAAQLGGVPDTSVRRRRRLLPRPVGAGLPTAPRALRPPLPHRARFGSFRRWRRRLLCGLHAAPSAAVVDALPLPPCRTNNDADPHYPRGFADDPRVPYPAMPPSRMAAMRTPSPQAGHVAAPRHQPAAPPRHASAAAWRRRGGARPASTLSAAPSLPKLRRTPLRPGLG